MKNSKISRLYIYSSDDEELLSGDVQVILPKDLNTVPYSVILEDAVGKHTFSVNAEKTQETRDKILRSYSGEWIYKTNSNTFQVS